MFENILACIPSQHSNKPKFVATLRANTKQFSFVENILLDLKQAFDVDKAAGKQLDAVGVRVGASRMLTVPLTDVYFSWGAAKVGWNKGLWRGRFDPVSQLAVLPDSVFRLFIKSRIAANKWDGTIPGAYRNLEIMQDESGGAILMQDNQNMSVVIGFVGISANPIFEQLLLQQYVPLKPAGVRVDWYAVTEDGGRLFVWNGDSVGLSGWNNSNFPKKIKP